MMDGFLFVGVDFGFDSNNIDEMAFMSVSLFNDA